MGSFLTLVKTEVPDVCPEAVVYLEEAVAAFYAGCLVACCVMLGVAAEAEFLRLLEVAARAFAREGADTSLKAIAAEIKIMFTQ